MWQIDECGVVGAIHGASSAKKTNIVMKHSPTVASGLKRAARSTLCDADDTSAFTGLEVAGAATG